MIDSTVVRAHQHSAGAKKDGEDQRSALAWRTEHQDPRPGRRAGQPDRLLPTGGEAHDLVGADQLLPTMEADTLIADKAFDADARVLEPLAAAGKTAVIPPRSNRSSPRDYDRELYGARHLIENFFAKIKQFRAIATRYEKHARNFLLASSSSPASFGLIDAGLACRCSQRTTNSHQAPTRPAPIRANQIQTKTGWLPFKDGLQPERARCDLGAGDPLLGGRLTIRE